MKYKYTPAWPPPEHSKWVKRPIVSIEISGLGPNKKFLGLIDSGADCSLFNIEIAEILKIDLSKAKEINLTGISGELKGYQVNDLEIKVEGFEEPIKIPVCFVDSSSVGVLLGQDGFFDQYKIKFIKKHDSFELSLMKK